MTKKCLNKLKPKGDDEKLDLLITFSVPGH